MAAESTDGQGGVLVVAQLRQRETDFLTPRLHQV